MRKNKQKNSELIQERTPSGKRCRVQPSSSVSCSFHPTPRKVPSQISLPYQVLSNFLLSLQNPKPLTVLFYSHLFSGDKLAFLKNKYIETEEKNKKKSTKERWWAYNQETLATNLACISFKLGCFLLYAVCEGAEREAAGGSPLPFEGLWQRCAMCRAKRVLWCFCVPVVGRKQNGHSAVKGEWELTFTEHLLWAS